MVGIIGQQTSTNSLGQLNVGLDKKVAQAASVGHDCLNSDLVYYRIGNGSGTLG
jgi:hypothetical protein